VNVPLLLLLLLLLDGRSSANERLLWLLRIHHVRMDRLEIALRSVHLHRLLLLLDLLVLDNIGSVRMLEMLLLLLLGMLNLPLMQVKVLLLLLLVNVMLLVLLLQRLLLLHVMRMNSGWW
jgi:hypothetical protein